MTNPMIRINTGEEIIDRPMTDEEFAVWSEQKAKDDAKEKAIKEMAIAKEALLSKLGITEDEAKLLLS
jgi:hypothetical protein